MSSSHLDSLGRARMVDVSGKSESFRTATAEGFVVMRSSTLSLISSGASEKGDVLGVARLAGIQAAKRTSETIPLCHPLPLSSASVTFESLVEGSSCRLRVESECRVSARTGAEMEALCAVSAACLTVYDMLKSVERGMTIEGIRLLRKSGGSSGDYVVEGV